MNDWNFLVVTRSHLKVGILMRHILQYLYFKGTEILQMQMWYADKEILNTFQPFITKNENLVNFCI